MDTAEEQQGSSFSGTELRAALDVVQKENNLSAKSDSRSEADDYDEVHPGIWVSSKHFAISIPKLTEVGITHVLNCAEGKGLAIDRFICVTTGSKYYEDTAINYKGIQAVDSLVYDLSKHFEECGDFVADALKQDGKVLVHCMQGRSRSVAIVAAYLIKYSDMSAKQAILQIGSKREICPNLNFINLLSLYDSKLHNPAHSDLTQNEEKLTEHLE